LLGGSPCNRVGLDREYGFDLGRVVLECASVAAADLDHPPAQTTQQPRSERARHRIRSTQLSLLEQTRESRLLGAVQGYVGHAV
jgi:hypothetical protein